MYMTVQEKFHNSWHSVLEELRTELNNPLLDAYNLPEEHKETFFKKFALLVKKFAEEFDTEKAAEITEKEESAIE